MEKAKLLHDLFPAEIPGFIEFTAAMCRTIKEEEATQRERWEDGLFSFDFWLGLVTEAETKIIRYGIKLDKSSGLFADQLFNGYLAVYAIHCLTIYTTVKQHPNRKFTLAVDLLFR